VQWRQDVRDQCGSTFIKYSTHYLLPSLEAERSKAWVCGRSLLWIVGSNHAGGRGCPSLVRVIWCLVEVSATSRLLIQRSPAERGVSARG
jgi:hypothetical protein